MQEPQYNSLHFVQLCNKLVFESQNEHLLAPVELIRFLHCKQKKYNLSKKYNLNKNMIQIKNII